MLRLRRVGKIKQPSYRLIVNEKAQDTKGTYLECLGVYNPRTQPATVKFNADRIHYWLSHGAQASPTVHNLLVDEKILTGAKKVKASKSKKATAQAVAPNTEAAKPAEAPAT